MRKSRPASAGIEACIRELADCSIEPDLAEPDHDAHAMQERDLLRHVRRAAHELLGSGLFFGGAQRRAAVMNASTSA